MINGYPGRPSINVLNQSNRHGAYFLPDDNNIFYEPVKKNGVSCTHKIPHAHIDISLLAAFWYRCFTSKAGSLQNMIVGKQAISS